METKLEKEVRFLKAYAVVATLVCAVFVLSAFTLQSRRQRFEEIDVERINIVEKDGKLKLVISNKERTPDVPVAGKVLPRGNVPGMFFYNDEGDECGGLVFEGGQKKDGKYEAHAGLFFDQYRQDQTLGLSYVDSDGSRRAGLIVWDRPNISTPEQIERLKAVRAMKDGPEKEAAMKPLRGPLRVYIGKTRDDSASAVLLSDAEGRTRISMKVDPAGQPKLEFFDASGKVIQSLPDDHSATKK